MARVNIVQDYVASIYADPNFIAAMYVAITGSLFNLDDDPVKGMKHLCRLVFLYCKHMPWFKMVLYSE